MRAPVSSIGRFWRAVVQGARNPLGGNSSRGQTSYGVAIAAPVEGWDTESPLAAMPERRAVIMDNAVPKAGYIEARKGFVVHATNLGTGPVETLMTWQGATGAELFAACSGTVYDVTSVGTATATSITGTANDRWASTNFGNNGGQFLIAVNGTDQGISYNGSAWSTITLTSTVTALTLTSSAVDLIMTHKSRVWFGEKDSLRIWFTDTNAIQGSCGLLNLAPLLGSGGSLIAMGTWSQDSGDGPDDYAVFVTTNGEIAVFAGIDPTDPTDWRLISKLKVGRPLGKRCLTKYGGDLILLCSDGALPMSQLVGSTYTRTEQVAITARIAPTFSQAAQLYGDNFGWDAWNYTAGSLLIFNVPTLELATSQQYVQSLVTGGWCRFVGINAWCWGGLDNGLFFGGNGTVYQADQGAADGAAQDGTGGNPIVIEIKSAFNYLGRRGDKKHVTMIQPVLQLSSNLNTRPAVVVDVDFDNTTPTAVPVASGSSAGRWDSGNWDSAVWAGNDQIVADWTGATALGYALAPHLQYLIYSADDVTVRLLGFNMNYSVGGRL